MRAQIRDGSIDRHSVHVSLQSGPGGSTHPDNQFFNNLHRHPQLVRLARICLGEDICHYLSRLLVKDEEINASIECHQDWPYFHGNTRKLSIMVAVTPSTEDNGKLFYVAGSHHFGPLTRGRVDYERFPELPRIGPDLELGDVVLHDFLTWHYSMPSRTGEDRAMIQIVYQPSSDASSKQLVSGRLLNPYSCVQSFLPMARVDRAISSLSVAQARAAWEGGGRDFAIKVCTGIIGEDDVSRVGALALLSEMALADGNPEESRRKFDQLEAEHAALGDVIDKLRSSIATHGGVGPVEAIPASTVAHTVAVRPLAGLGKTLFAISSWSNAGSQWVVECLNLHPLIHALLHGHTLKDRVLPPIEYMEFIARESSSEQIARGDVHGVGPERFGELEAAFGDAFRGGHLVAHPVTRLVGSFNFSVELGREWNHDFFLSHWGLQRGSLISDRVLAILGEMGDHVPAHYMMNVNNVGKTLRPQHSLAWPAIKLEELMRSDEAWDRLVHHISGGAITDYGPRWRTLENVYLGTAHKPFSLAGPRAAWETLPDYARQVFAAMLSKDARASYEELGYDLSFVPDHSGLG